MALVGMWGGGERRGDVAVWELDACQDFCTGAGIGIGVVIPAAFMC